MNVRDATRDDEPWILDTLGEIGDPDPGFRWYDYVVVETDDGDRVGTGRLTERGEGTVELTHVGGVGDRPATAAAYAAKGLVERAIEDGYGTILAVAERTRPYEVVGFEAADGDAADAVEAAEGETVLRWVPSSERDDGDEAAETDAETDAGDDGSGERDGTGEVASQQTDADPGRRTKYATAPSDAESGANAARADGDGATGEGASAADEAPGDGASEAGGGGSSYKYDTGSSPATGADGTDSESSDESPTTREDSTADAARRQGIEPDRVNAKYGTEDDDESKRTKYDT